jgi:2-iminobutanoate/2-iminopropanoate deaminase
MKKIIHTKNAPAPIGPYNQAVQTGDTLYVSGQIAIDPTSNSLIVENLEAETHQVMKNLKAVVEAAGYGMEDVAKCSIFISNMENFGRINDVYGSYFASNFPARETVEVSCLPKNVNVEVSCVAVKSRP